MPSRSTRAVARAAAALLAAVLVLPLGWSLVSGDVYLTVTSGSMAPTYEVGDVLVVRRPVGDELTRVGAVVVARLAADGSGGTYVHRVVGPTEGGAWLQGDANPDRDPRPVSPDAVVGTPRAALSGWAGAALGRSQTVVGRVVLAGALLALLLVGDRRAPRGAHARRHPSPSEVA